MATGMGGRAVAALGRGLRAVLGELAWQPPAWSRRSAAQLRRRPWHWSGGFVVAAVLVWTVHWWWTRPPALVPDAVTVSAQAPALTDYRRMPARAHPLRLRFSAPVAPLPVVGTPAQRSSEPQGLSLVPDLAGTWIWLDDRQLQFQPAEDWPVGRGFQVRIDPRQALVPGLSLAQTRYDFATPTFELRLSASEFYQDPEDPRLKRGVYTLEFSHPVDAESLLARVRLQLRDGAGREQSIPGHSVRHDEDGLTAWLQSEPLDLPENGGRLQLSVAEGVRSRLGGDGRSKAVTAAVPLPALYSVQVGSAQALLVDNERFEPEQVLSLSFNERLRDSEVADAVAAWLLPERYPQTLDGPTTSRHHATPFPWQAGQVDERVLALSEPLPLELLPPEQEWSEQHSFRYQAPPGRRMLLRVQRGLRSFGGFVLGQADTRVLVVPPYPSLLRFVGDGALLSLRGERRVSIVARNQPGVRLELARVLPGQLHHLVSAGGRYGQPDLWRFGEDALVERMEQRVSLPAGDPARAHYEGVDLGEFLAPGRRGVFLLSLRELSEQDRARRPEDTLAYDAGREHDRRLVVLTDLGVIAKHVLDGGREVYVQSLSGGGPVAGAQVQVVARNGEVLISRKTDADGRASLPVLDGYRRERQPVMLVVRDGEDLSFLPLDRHERMLDTSRFDVGGEPNDHDPGVLRATVFSDRGLYRPGETVHLGLILRTGDWTRSPAGLPMELVVTDPRGTVARRQTIAFGSAGFEEASFTPPVSAASGAWQVGLYRIEDERRRHHVGGTTVQVREFQPDTLRVRVRLDRQGEAGWLHPHGLTARVDVENLFGTPAQDRRVDGELQLRPVLPQFARWPGFRFHDPHRAQRGVVETLAERRTGDNGEVELALDLDRYERASYRLDLLVRAYEPGSGRAVSAQTGVLVSEADYLVGLRSPDTLRWVQRGDPRDIELLAIGPDTQPVAVDGLRAVLVERRFVSVLTRSRDGLYRYVSRERRDIRKDEALPLSAEIRRLSLDTTTPGDWTLELRDQDDVVLNRIDWTVAGSANLSRNLERNAELAISLSKSSYATGEEIELSLRAPYTGRGLITIERDRVYAHAWFQADTTASIQRIRVPEGIEGNAYVSVHYLRGLDSDEIFTSPLSFGVMPFQVDREARSLPLRLELPARARPGQPVRLSVHSSEAARVAVFAVDEGILQVAGYRVPNPLDHFLRKRMHQVRTAQILDLLLPEFSRFLASSAAGGDGEAGAARHLNPFRRRGEAPAVWWSGLLDIDGEHELVYHMPDHFNGRLRVVAVGVSAGRMGIAEAEQIMRDDFVLTPTVPTHVAPGDVFELPVGIANTVDDVDGGAIDVALELELTEQLTLESDPAPSVRLKPGDEGLVRVRLRASAAPGVAAVHLRARWGEQVASRRIELSIRPETVPYTRLRVERVERRMNLGELRDLHEAFSARNLSASSSPLIAIDGFGAWLDGFAHACTEQLVSRAIPALVGRRHPEFARGGFDPADWSKLIDVLRTRQNSEGGFGYWRAGLDADPFVSGYVVLVLLEARERGLHVPDDMLAAAGRYLRGLAADAARTGLDALRARALAVYLLARQGQSVGDLLATVQAQLERDHPEQWRDDTAGNLVAASFALLQELRAARPLAARSRELAGRPLSEDRSFTGFRDVLIDQAWRVYLLHRHSPAQAERLADSALTSLIDPIREQRFNTLSAALAILALEAAGARAGAVPVLEAAGEDGRPRPIGAVSGVLRRAMFGADDRSLWVTPASGAMAWYALSEAGFDRTPDVAVQDMGLEVQRDYLDREGRPTTQAALGDELTVRIRLRARGDRRWSHVAITDLLPGGFELVLTPQPGHGGNDLGASEASTVQALPRAPVLALPGSSFHPDHAEMREDRVVLYGTVSPQLTEFRYRIRAASAGEFAIPPVHAESMYRQDVFARGGPVGRMRVGGATP